MYKKFLPLLFFSFFILQFDTNLAAQSTANEFEYYLKFNNVVGKSSIKEVIKVIKEKSSVNKLLMANAKNPYFIIQSKIALTKDKVQSWVTSKYIIKTFEITNTKDALLMKKIRLKNLESKN